MGNNSSHAPRACNACRNHISFIVAMLLVTVILPAQAQEPAHPESETNNDLLLNWSDVEKNIWANAKPYMDDPVPELEEAVPELKGLDPAPGQEQLSSILSRVGSRCFELSQRTPNVISDEKVTTQMPHSSPLQQKFGYLLLSRQTPTGTVVEEYRTDSRGHPWPEQPGTGPSSQGFASMWVRFYPGNQAESRFRYLGQQELDKYKTLVLGLHRSRIWSNSPGSFYFREQRSQSCIKASPGSILQISESFA